MKLFLTVTILAFAVWLIVLNVRVILSFVQTDRPWRFRRPDRTKVRPGRVYRLRVALHYLGCAVSVLNPVFEPIRPVIAKVKRLLWLPTEPVMRLVRKLPVKAVITWESRKQCQKRSWKVRLTRSEIPPRRGLILDASPFFTILLSYGLVLKALVADYTSETPSATLAVVLWVAFLVSVALFVPKYKAVAAS